LDALDGIQRSLEAKSQEMIPVVMQEEPKSFDQDVRVPGKLAIAELVGEKPKRSAGKRFQKKADRREDIPSSAYPPYWRQCLADLMEAYDYTCAFSCFRIHPVTGAPSVDHMAPKSRQWDKIYEWSNYRLACARMNAQKLDFEDLIDPFDVQPNWFYLELVGFSVYPNPDLSRTLQSKIRLTIDRLKLNAFREQRAIDAETYWNGLIAFSILQRESPFVARELQRQNRLRKG
jgi:hypothetical protein